MRRMTIKYTPVVVRKPATKSARKPKRITRGAMLRVEEEVNSAVWRKGLPHRLHQWLGANMGVLVDNWGALVELLGIPAVDAPAMEDNLSDHELIDSVSAPYCARAGYVVAIIGSRLGVLHMLSETVETYTHPPEHIAYQLGMLKLQDVGTFVRDCGYRHSETTFYVLEKKDEQSDQP